MLVQSATRSSGPGPQLLRLLLTSSHSQQQTPAAAATRAYATGDDARSQEGVQLQRYGQRSRREVSAAQQQQQEEETVFDARAASEPLRVHQLIGDPRTGVADDTTTAPFSNDIKVEHLIEVPPRREGQESTHWFRYSMAGAALPYMYMDSRLSDHSKNLMYLLRAKDPARWTIPALADKFRIRRQRVMAILAFKEIQAHQIQAGSSMAGPLSHYVYNVPLADLCLDEHGQPKDLMQLVTEQAAAQQQQLQQQQQQLGAAAAAGVQTLESAEGLGSLEEFLAVDGSSSSSTGQQAGTAAGSSSGSSGAGVSRADQAADLAVLMPHIAFTAQQLQLQLLQLLQTHHYSVAELQRHLLQQIDVAEAYYKAHIEGTPLQDLLMGASSSSSSSADTQQPAAAAAAQQQEAGEAAADGADAASGAAAVPSFLDFALQRQAVQQLTGLLEPLLAAAGPQAEREAGRLLVALQAALQQQQQQGESSTAAADAAADAGSDGAPEAAGDAAGGQQQQQQQGLSELIGAAAPATLVSAFNSLPVEQRQQLLDAVPSVRITLNIQGTDLQAALSSSSSADSSSTSQDESAAAASSSSSSSPGEWPGQVPPLVDVWGFEEVPRRDLSALLEALPGLQALLGQEGVGTLAHLSGASNSSKSSGSSSSSSKMGAQDIAAVQQAVQVYSGLLLHYDLALTDQAIAATGSEAAAVLPAASQRRLARILRELDPNAVQKLLLWESVFKEEAEGGSSRRLNRLRMRVQATVKALDKQAAASSGYRPPSEEYPDLPASVRAEGRRDRDMLAAKLEAEVVGRQFHRGSGDRPYVSMPTYPRFEGLTMEEFDATREGEISIINRLAAERQDNVMWREFRTRLLRNMGLLAPDLAQHSGIVKPPKPAAGWSWVVHPVGGAAKAAVRERLRVESAVQWEDEQQDVGAMRWYAEQDLQGRPAVRDPARDPAPAYPYVAEPGGRFRALNEEEAVVAGDTQPKPRPRWFVNKRG